MVELGMVRVQHTYREGNSLTDFLANWCFNSTGTISFNNFKELPKRAKAITMLDKQQISHLRVRRMKQQLPY